MNKIFSILFFSISLFLSIVTIYGFYLNTTSGSTIIGVGNIQNSVLFMFWIISAFQKNKKAFVFFVPFLFLFSFFLNNFFRLTFLNPYVDAILNFTLYFATTLFIYLFYPKLFKKNKNEKINKVNK